ncbi:3-ketoacyl-ACP reductase [Methylocapsa sp. S129]|uniref:3-ketoacyl-ACP reductase n=1 Tax=Methylocapsa sp. S129 TaxID=1641869 RepID=UPI00131ABF7E|nr:3-ketoacyl-ACP reductase [Methylocapsa sp. S129]
MSAARPVALVTGARRGIGRACGEALARAGFDIAATDLVIDATAREAQAAFETAGASAAFFTHDLAAIDSHAALVASVLQRFKRLDCLVNNAGRGAVIRGDLLALAPENFDAVMSVNLRGALFLTQTVARAMLGAGETGHPRSIVTITSVSAEMVSPDRAEYCVSKAGLSMAMKAFAARLAPEGIAVFEVRPGIIRTDMTAPVAGRYDSVIAGGLVPARRWGEAADVGAIVAGLASGRFAFATGSVVAADGGLSLPRL